MNDLIKFPSTHVPLQALGTACTVAAGTIPDESEGKKRPCHMPYVERHDMAPAAKWELAFKSVSEATAALKAVRNMDDFTDFDFKLTTCTGYFHHTDLCMKRSGYSTQGHDTYPHNAAKCWYMICDGKSNGCARWENLYKVFEVRIQLVKYRPDQLGYIGC